MSSALIFGFFPLVSAVRHSSPRKNSQATTTHIEYTSVLKTGANQKACTIRVWVSPSTVAAAPNTVAFVVGKLHAPPNEPVLIDAHDIYPVPGDPSSDNYEDHIPNLDAPWVVVLGHASSPASKLPDGVSRGFSITASEYIRGTPLSAPYHVRFNGNTTRWANTPVPYINTACQAYGQVTSSFEGMLSFDVANITLNVAPLAASLATAAPNPTSSSGSPAKKRRFQVATADDAALSNSTAAPAPAVPPIASTSTLPTAATVPSVAIPIAPVASGVDADAVLADDDATSAKARGKRRA